MKHDLIISAHYTRSTGTYLFKYEQWITRRCKGHFSIHIYEYHWLSHDSLLFDEIRSDNPLSIKRQKEIRSLIIRNHQKKIKV